MNIETVMAQMIISDLQVSTTFYSAMFGRDADARPMERLAEWHLAGGGGVQVFEEAARAGKSGVTIAVSSLDEQVRALAAAGIEHEPPMDATYVRLITLSDPDQNRIVFTQ